MLKSEKKERQMGLGNSLLTQYMQGIVQLLSKFIMTVLC